MWRQSYHTIILWCHPWKAQNTFYIQINWWFDYHLKNERGRIYLPYLIFRSSWSSSIALLSEIEGNFLQLVSWELSLIFAYLPTLYRAISWVFVWKSWLWTDDWMCSDGSLGFALNSSSEHTPHSVWKRLGPVASHPVLSYNISISVFWASHAIMFL
jgi:hypothetical protein